MLGSNDVDRFKCGCHIGAHHHRAVIIQRRRGDFRARAFLHVLVNTAFHLVNVCLARGYQVARCQRIVLGLRHKVNGHQHGIGRFIGHNAYLGRTGNHVNAAVARHNFLRSGNKRVTRTRYLAYGLDSLRTIRQRANGLRATHRVNLGDAAQLCRFQNSRIKRAILSGWRAAYDALHTRYQCWQRIHQQR